MDFVYAISVDQIPISINLEMPILNSSRENHEKKKHPLIVDFAGLARFLL